MKRDNAPAQAFTPNFPQFSHFNPKVIDHHQSSASDDDVRGVVERILPLGIELALTWGRSRCVL